MDNGSNHRYRRVRRNGVYQRQDSHRRKHDNGTTGIDHGPRTGHQCGGTASNGAHRSASTCHTCHGCASSQHIVDTASDTSPDDDGVHGTGADRRGVVA